MKSIQSKDIVQFAVVAGVLLLINFFVSDISLRWDLTEDGRYSVSQDTKDALEKVKGNVRVEVYLEGDMPASYSQLARGIKEKLQDLNVYSGGKLDVEFIDPFDGPDSTKKKMQYFLQQRGIKPVVVQKKEDGKILTKALYPSVVIAQNGMSVGVNLLKKGKITQSGQEIGELSREDIEKTLSSLEFELINGIKMVAVEGRKKIAFLAGQGELEYQELKDVEGMLQQYYELYIYNLDSLSQEQVNAMDLIVCARPTSELTDLDKYKLDQYVMQGGNAMFFIDALEQRPGENGDILALPYKLNVRDLLFSWGVRINDEIVLDLESIYKPVEVEGNMKLVPSTYTPRIVNFNKEHKITKGLQALAVQDLIGSLDTTTSAQGVTKTPLFFTSQYARKKPSPFNITGFDITHPVLEKEIYTHSYLPLAYLLEGEFKSFFKNKPVPKGGETNNRLDGSNGKGKVIVVGDGGLIANTRSSNGVNFHPAGFSPYEMRTYQNLIFFNNAIDYMMEKEFITEKGTAFVSRPLDKIKIKEEKNNWTAINLVVPNVIVIVFGLIFWFIRKRRFTRF